ncbi:restriction endonuclease subunit S [Flavobacterium sp. NST-5]|uniref:Restriction endonuclease subunit S n=1 Tax=Flavobacterium ichthyis TaxID=2698827 RepID=A0ABW9ZCP4_9FLAO|nr:restriction endonuclease subunit S [Flavobacterium ichthyis]NBL65855.1 restriction endonuclease subunit S [Flavobacterium ichthyis]
MSYKRLGDYIIEKVEFNDGDKYKLLQGVSNNKYFQKAKTNIIGIDLSKYRVAHYNQFVFNRATTRNGDKISIALRKGESCIVSPSYRIFEVRDENVLHPDYLQMWFTRPEFDRYARFKSHGSAHEFFDMEDMCEVELPIPSIEKQRQIVAQYQSVTNKIKVNEQICEKLEATAQALYKHWFVDFEFPNEEGKPYKSSGGVMVWNEELGKEIPEGWEVKSFTETVKLTGGGTPSTEVWEYWNGNIPFFTPADIQKSYYSISTLKNITELGLKKSSTKLYPKNTVFITARGTVGAIGLSSQNMAMNQSCYAIKDSLPYYIHQKTLNVIEKLKDEAVGAVFSALVTKDFDQQNVLEPNEFIKIDFNNGVKNIYGLLLCKSQEIQKLTHLQSLLLSRLAVGEEINNNRL